jgi:hypothetical protein
MEGWRQIGADLRRNATTVLEENKTTDEPNWLGKNISVDIDRPSHGRHNPAK